MSLTAGTRVGPYEIIGLLGAGGMGEVYRARDSRLDRGVAVKVMRPSFASDTERVRRFELEARTAGILNDSHILAIYDVGTHEGSPYLVSELLEGQTLRERLRGGALPVSKALDYALQIAQGLGAAHQKGIVHRDLKPENLFITRNGVLKILDFGLAKLIEPIYEFSDDSTERFPSVETDRSALMGTAGYMSPEQVQQRRSDTRADIFAFGAILYEMLTGQRAFRKASPVETMAAIVTEDPAPIPSGAIPSALGPIVRHCLEKDPEQRFQSVRDLIFNLREVTGHPEGREARRKPHSRRYAAVRAALIAVGLAGSFVAGEQVIKRSSQGGAFPTFRRVTFREGTVTAARFAPDGQTIIYGAKWEGKPVEIFSGQADVAEARAFGLADSSVLAISAAGEMAIIRGCEINWGYCTGTLARLPLAGGAPRDVLEEVDFADWFPDGKELAVVRAVGGNYRLEYPIGKVLYETAGFISHMRVSPRGDLIAFLDHPAHGDVNGSVAIVDLQGNKRVLAEGLHNLLGLSWQPKGEEIWFTGTRAGRGAQRLYGVTIAGVEREILRVPTGLILLDISPRGNVLLNVMDTPGRIVCRPPGSFAERDLSWFDWGSLADLSQDGRMLLFYEWGAATNGAYVTFLRKTDGSAAVRLGEGKAWALSPDGKWALISTQARPRQLVLLPTGAGESKALPRGHVEEFYSAVWFPDSRRILFVGEDANQVPRSYIQDANTGDARQILSNGVIAILVSPDGKRVAGFNTDIGHFVFPVEGGRPVPILGALDKDVLLQWSADGRFIYVRGVGDDVAHIFRINLSSGRREHWKDLAPRDLLGSIGVEAQPRGGVRITPDGKNYAYGYWKILNQLFLVEGLK